MVCIRSRSTYKRVRLILLCTAVGTCLLFLVVERSVPWEVRFRVIPWLTYLTPLTGPAPRYQKGGLIRISRLPHSEDAALTCDGCETVPVVNDELASELFKRVRILVWVMTSPSNLDTKARAVKETWAKRCNSIIFFSSLSDPEFPAVGLGVVEGRGHLTAKTMAAFRYLYQYHLNDADWFMKTDDDTFLIPENLRYFLSDKNSSDPLFYGHHYHPTVDQGYYSGGSGYVVSKEALRRFGARAVNNGMCAQDGFDEDVDWGRCMEKLGVKSSVSADPMGRTLFHPLDLHAHFLGKLSSWYQMHSSSTGKAVSPYAVSFHYVEPADMKVLDFFLNRLRAFGIHTAYKKKCTT